jgi:hypothetical protein
MTAANIAKNISSPTLVKSGTGRIDRVSVVANSFVPASTYQGTTPTLLYDSSSTGGVSNSNLIASIAPGLSISLVDLPFVSGLVVVPGTNSSPITANPVVVVSYD